MYDGLEKRLKTIAIDPGSNMCGMAVVELDLATGIIHVTKADTIRAVDLIRNIDKRLISLAGERYTRNNAYGNYLVKLVNDVKPSLIGIESPFMGKFAQAYKALTEHVTLLKNAVYRYDPYLQIDDLAPTEVKAGVGAKGTKKEDIRKALLDRTDIVYHNGLVAEDFDEHTVDAVCVGITQLTQVKKVLIE